MDPRGMIGIVKRTTITLLHTKYESVWICGFGEDFFSFSHCKSMGAICCHGNHNFQTICSKIPQPIDDSHQI